MDVLLTCARVTDDGYCIVDADLIKNPDFAIASQMMIGSAATVLLASCVGEAGSVSHPNAGGTAMGIGM